MSKMIEMEAEVPKEVANFLAAYDSLERFAKAFEVQYPTLKQKKMAMGLMVCNATKVILSKADYAALLIDVVGKCMEALEIDCDIVYQEGKWEYVGFDDDFRSKLCIY